MANDTTANCPCTVDDLLNNWLGHRRLTRRVIEAFPDDKLFTFSVGGMRPFGELVHEFLGMALPVANQVSTGAWGNVDAEKPTDKAGLLRVWDEHSRRIAELVPTIPVEQYHKRFKIYEQWEVTGIEAIQYTVDNENHHRGQGYVFLRALGIEPPAFYDRS